MGIAYYENKLQKVLKNNIIRCLEILDWDQCHEFEDLVDAGIPRKFFDDKILGERYWVHCTSDLTSIFTVFHYADTLDQLLRKMVGEDYGSQ